MQSLSLHMYSQDRCPPHTHCSLKYQCRVSSTISLTRYQTLPQVSENSLSFLRKQRRKSLINHKLPPIYPFLQISTWWIVNPVRSTFIPHLCLGITGKYYPPAPKLEKKKSVASLRYPSVISLCKSDPAAQHKGLNRQDFRSEDNMMQENHHK